MSKQQTCILVLGMHRSGTSALTGVLELLDIYLGSELTAASASENAKGFFENKQLLQINKDLLAQVGSNWDNPFYNASDYAKITDLTQLKETIATEFEFSNTFAIKDPRLAYLFPLYERVLTELNIDIKVILPYRNPIEVASSLHTRNNMSMEKGMLLWAYHFLLAEEFTRNHKRVFVAFNELMSDTKNVIDAIATHLDLELQTKYLEQEALIHDFLDPDLKHHNISLENLSKNTPLIVQRVLQLKANFNDKKSIEKFDVLRNEFFSYQKLFYNDEIIGLASNITRLEETLETTKESIVKRDNAIKGKNIGLQERDNAIKEKNEALILKDKTLQKKNELISQKEKEIEKEKSSLLTANKSLKKQAKEIENLKTELTGIYLGKSWRITRPLRKIMKLFGKN